ncbi:hypothetical protein V494_06400 [Pseudogymnoascus sp. VKM F-4513 (FW-928)]|nr:hypothetical protein V494_06400 [Pseudogymnoascus sp. VKM F-4513 (FW-928)]
MCLVKVSKNDEPEEPPRVYVRRRESVSHSRRTSQVIIRPIQERRTRRAATGIRPSSRIGLPFEAHLPGYHSPNHDFPPLRHAHYLNRDCAASCAAPFSVCRWLWVPKPQPGPGKLPNDSAGADAQSQPEEQPAHQPYTRRDSARQGSQRSQRSRHGSQRHSRHNSGEIFIVNPPVRERSRSPAVETRGRADSHAVRHVRALSREERDPSREPSRERRSNVHLTAPLSPMEVDKVQRGLDASRDTMMVEDVRPRARSITYGANPRMSAGRLEDRERVLIEEDGRRREFYKTKSLSP